MENILLGVKNIHFIGIGGAGMSSLAFFLKDKGYNVTGSDISESSKTRELQAYGIKVFIGHKKEQLSADTDILGYSSAITVDNPEIIEAQNKGITILKRGWFLAELCKGAKTVAVAGSHGKTTTTSLISYLLTSLGYNPAVFLGGTCLNHTQPAKQENDYFVVETDESDGSFLYCQPWVSLLTNIDREHLEYYQDFEGLKKSFFQFAGQAKNKVIGWGDQPYLSKIVSALGGISFGWEETNLVRGKNFKFDSGFSCFDLYIKENFILSAKLPLLGRHNCLNALAAFAFLYHLGEDLEKANKALRGFKGTKRRFQVKENLRGVTFVDDYAHHPTEIKAVITSARLLKPKRLFVVFQPHRYSRVQSLYEEFSNCFSGVDKLVITDIYGACEQACEGISSQALCKKISAKFSGELEYIPKDKIPKVLPYCFETGDLVLALGAGDINILISEAINEFREDKSR
ncbi:MAG: UDP-N-acetylmuramate--L-alanine ligase [Candidatus Omnitrophota bacterium]